MNNAMLKLAAFILLASSFIACEEETSLRSQLIGHWKSSKVVIVENDVAVEIRDSLSYHLVLEESLNYQMETTTKSLNNPTPAIDTLEGDWAIQEINHFLTLSDFNSTPIITWDVSSISDSQMTLEAFWENNTQKLYRITFNRQ
jgi:hypothetical protein